VIAVVVIEAIAIALLGLLVAGLLRSHADILRRLHALSVGREQHPPGQPDLHVAPGVVLPRQDAAPAFDLSGQSPTGEAVAISVTAGLQTTLLAFLSSGCVTCQGFWDDFRQSGDLGLPGGIRLVIVTKGPDDESVSRVRTLAPGQVPVVMSTASWSDYGVPGAPYFILVGGPSGMVAGEGSAGAWSEVKSFIEQSLADAEAAARGEPGRAGGQAADRIDTELMAAGIGPGHPSLYGRNGTDGDSQPSSDSPEHR
jgi:hypothetical protein